MNTQSARWRVVAPISDQAAWELQLAELSELAVEGIVEMDDRAEIYFMRAGDALEAAARYGWPPPTLGAAGGGEVFGETQHPTTGLCLELMISVMQEGDQVADIGSGTGRLSAEAMKLGAHRCVAVDVDWPAAVASRDSLAGFDRALAVQGSADALATAGFEGVVANLHLALWRELAPEIARISKSGTWLVASGFLEEQEAEIRGLLDEWGWRVKRVEEDGGWIAFTATQ